LFVCMFDFVRAHLPVLDGGVAAGKESRVLCMRFCHQVCSVLTASHPWLTALSVFILRIACTCWSQVERGVWSAKGQNDGPRSPCKVYVSKVRKKDRVLVWHQVLVDKMLASEVRRGRLSAPQKLAPVTT
jgi:hypothetical protein